MYTTKTTTTTALSGPNLEEYVDVLRGGEFAKKRQKKLAAPRNLHASVYYYYYYYNTASLFFFFFSLSGYVS